MQAPEGIDIIIPTFNERTCISQLILYLKMYGPAPLRIIVSDGNSTDDTCEIAAKVGAFVVNSPLKGRAAHMNYGASFANQSVLYFVHGDCLPPQHYYASISKAVANCFALGRF